MRCGAGAVAPARIYTRAIWLCGGEGSGPRRQGSPVFSRLLSITCHSSARPRSLDLLKRRRWPSRAHPWPPRAARAGCNTQSCPGSTGLAKRVRRGGKALCSPPEAASTGCRASTGGDGTRQWHKAVAQQGAEHSDTAGLRDLKRQLQNALELRHESKGRHLRSPGCVTAEGPRAPFACSWTQHH